MYEQVIDAFTFGNVPLLVVAGLAIGGNQQRPPPQAAPA
jgi:hypothetical protein